jgi:exonuclease SbcD
VKVWGKLSENPADHWMTIKKGADELEVCALPFFRSYEILRDGNTDAIASLKNYLLKKKTIPQLLMLHHLAGMSEAGGSEQVVTLSGVDSIPTDILSTFDYVALGHIHKPQRIGEKIYYSGSPIPMRFSESYAKSVMLLDLKEGKLSFEKFPIPVFRPIITVKADEVNYKEKILAIPEWMGLTTQVEIQLSLSAPKVGLIDEIKELLTKRGAELLSYQPLYIQNEKIERKNEKLFELSPLELFEEFYATKYPESPEIPPELKSDFAELLDKVKHASP